MIECHNIVKSYGKGEASTTVLKGISLTIQDGEFVSIMGPSGGGKSTLMNILGCLDTPTSGTYHLNGKDVSSLKDDELAAIRSQNIGFVFQSFNLLPRATVMRNVTMPLLYSDTPESEYISRGERALASSGLPPERWYYKTSQLSGGQMQRVAIARALVNTPSVVFADEPTGNLDSRTGAIVINTLQKLNRESGATIVLITHDRDTALHAHRVIHLRDGVILEDTPNPNPLMSIVPDLA
jgi:putative ABC transport system ATP-binding protein